MLHVYTDGSCRRTFGSWAFVAVRDGIVIKESCGVEAETTNNRMEMTAVIKAIELFYIKPITIHADSRYVVDGILEWLPLWKDNYWKTTSDKDVKNKDLWQRLDRLVGRHPNLQVKWVRGHHVSEWNHRADELCTEIRNRLDPGK